MATVTYIAGADVTSTFTTGVYAVVTTEAIASKAGMIYRCRYPLASAMAGITFFISDYMCSMFTGSDNRVMTTGAGAQYLAVIHL